MWRGSRILSQVVGGALGLPWAFGLDGNCAFRQYGLNIWQVYGSNWPVSGRYAALGVVQGIVGNYFRYT